MISLSSRWFTWAPADRAAPQSSLAAMSSLWWWFHVLKPENINLKPFPLNYHCPRLTLKCIMVSLYSTLSSSILLLVESTRGMKSEGMLTLGWPRKCRGSSGHLEQRVIFISGQEEDDGDDYLVNVLSFHWPRLWTNHHRVSVHRPWGLHCLFRFM